MDVSRRFRLFFCLILSLLLIATAGVTLVPRYLDLETYKQEILEGIRESLHRELTYDQGSFAFRMGPCFTFTNVQLFEKDGKNIFIKAKSVTFHLSIIPLLQKKFFLKDMIIDRPEGTLIRKTSGEWNFSDLVNDTTGAAPLHLKGLKIKNGTFRIIDYLAGNPAVETTLTGMDFSANRLQRGRKSDIKLSAKISGHEAGGTISTSGSIRVAEASESLRESVLDLKVSGKNISLGQYWPYYTTYVPFEKITGQLTVDANFTGKINRFNSKGIIRFSDLRFSYPKVFHAVLTPRNVRISYQMELGKDAVAVKKLDLSVDALTVKGECTIAELSTRDPRITAKATTSNFKLEDFRSYIPYGIIADDTSKFIEKHITGGVYKLLEGRLDGKASQIAHMEKGTNYNVLYIRGTVEKGIMTFGPKVPLFTEIRGELELSGKDFNLNRMSGKFGTTPFTLDGHILDYPLDTPSTYPFQATLVPQIGEISWLVREWGLTPAYSGKSILRLTGSGPTSGYLLSGGWDLTSAAYSIRNSIQKTVGVRNNLSFKSTLAKDSVQIGDLQFALGGLAVAANGSVSSEPRQSSKFTIKTNRFDLGEIAPYFPKIAKYQPHGNIQSDIHAEGRVKELGSMDFSGAVTFSGTSFRPVDWPMQVSNLTGKARFTGSGLETSLLAAKVGNSTVFAKIALENFDDPAITLAFSSPLLATGDIGLRNRSGKDLLLNKIQGNVEIHRDGLIIKSFSGQMNKTSAHIKGTIQDFRIPKVNLTINASFLDIDDFFLLTSLEQQKRKDFIAPPSISVTVQADKGTIRQISFEKLATTALLENGILYLRPVSFNAFDGIITGSARVDHGNRPTSHFQVSGKISNASAENILQSFGNTARDITGSVSLEADLTAKGATLDEIKKSTLGSVKVKMEDGTIRRFAVLSKVFSILNFSQLLKFQLPDMVSGGMPYTEITGTISFRDGYATSRDLFVNSDAMNISIVGKADIVREDLDVTIGVQPLQTVDKIVNKIPIVGWILTGKDRTLITSYFEAKGPWKDPKVSAVPVKALGKGILDIFKRVFQLPAKLITDTGEVLTGK